MATLKSPKPKPEKHYRATSGLLKAALLSYFRFQKQAICATEVSTAYWLSDVTAIYENKIVEVEVKVSWSDFVSEFKTKEHKHKLLHSGRLGIPNYFYFCVPDYLEERCSAYLKDSFPKAGLFIFSPYGTHGVREHYTKWIKFSKKATLLTALEVTSEGLKKNVIMRACSELCQFYQEDNGIIYESPDQLYFGESND